MGDLNEMIGTAVPRALKKRLLQQARHERRSMSQVVRLAIEDYLDAKEREREQVQAEVNNAKL